MLEGLETIASRAPATAAGDLQALHEMRIQLTRLRSAIAFFPTVQKDPGWASLKRDFKWLNRRLGAARDLDVVVNMQLPALTAEEQIDLDRRWMDAHLRLTRALHSPRFEHMVSASRAWANRKHWTTAGSRETAAALKQPMAQLCAQVIERWHRRLVKRSRDVAGLDADDLHRLRLRTKRLRYALEQFGRYHESRSPLWTGKMISALRDAQGALGRLNDAEQLPQGVRMPDKERKHLLKHARRAYEKIAALV